MRLYRNGEAVELTKDGEVEVLGDRAYVRTSEGTFTGVAVTEGGKVYVSYRGQSLVFETSKTRSSSGVGGGDEVRAPMPGMVIEVLAAVGDEVTLGQRLAVLEAMKTQQPLPAPRDGEVIEVLVSAGQQVQQGDVLVKLKPVSAG